MTYTSVDTIPSKVFFKILKTGHVNLLTDKIIVDEKENEEDNTITKKELDAIWVKIQAEDAELIKDNKSDKTLKIDVNVERLLSKLECINLSVFYLKIFPDDEDLINQLKIYGYQFSDNMTSDLEQIERETEGIVLKLKNYQRQLEKLKPKTKKGNETIPFDEVVLSYGALTGLAYRTNQITQSEYRALINVGNQKMKSIENSIGKNGKR